MSNENALHTAALREEYLAQIARGLQGRVSSFEAYEQIEEMRQHLVAMATAYEELGSTPEAAMREAITKFGQAPAIARGVARGTKRPRRFRVLGAPLSPATARRSIRTTARLVAAGTGIGTILTNLIVHLLAASTTLAILPPFARFAIGLYASCAVAIVCRSFPHRSPLSIGATATAFCSGIVFLATLVSHLTSGDRGASFLLLSSILGGIFVLGCVMGAIFHRIGRIDDSRQILS